MTDPNRCPTCGCELPADAGLCPECLLRQGFAENDSLAVEVGEDAGGSGLPVTTPPAPFEPPPAEELASLFPGLEIVKLLGHGGMGAVYQARQTKLDRLVALKIIRPESASDPAFAERFLREARTLAKLSHPSIVGVHDFGEVETEPASEEDSSTTLFYFVMEYIDGANLRQLIEAEELAPEAAIGIVPQLCDALQFAHDQGVVHRDIKPENILVDSRGQVKIADFGLARLTEASPRDFTLTATHQVMGTPRYMAPEQMEGSHDVDHRADIYSLGVVFYEMLTGQVPAGHFDPPSKKVQIDVRLDEVVLRSLAREPERRYQQVSEVKTDVESISQVASESQLDFGAPHSPVMAETSKADGVTVDFTRETKTESAGGHSRFLDVLAILVCLTGAASLFFQWLYVGQKDLRSTWWTPIHGGEVWPGMASAVAFVAAALLVIATGTLRPSPIWRGVVVAIAGGWSLVFSLAFPSVARQGRPGVIAVEWNSGVVLSVSMGAVLVLFGALMVRRRLKSENRNEALPEGTPLTTFHFSTSSPELSTLVPFHFEGLGYKLIERTETHWTFERGHHYSGLWSNDLRKYHTALTVRVATADEETQVDCSWVMRTWGAFFTDSEIAHLEDEGRELAARLNGKFESPMAQAASSESGDSVRVGTFSVGRTAVGLLIFFGVLFSIPYLLSLMMGGLGSENEDRTIDSSNGEVATTDAHDPGESEETGAELAADQKRRNTGLRTAVVANELQTAQQLLHDGADPNSVSMLGDKPISGQTPLIMAALTGNARMVALLLAMGADPSIQDNDGQTALMHAASKSHADVIRVIFEICDQKFGNQVVFRDHLRRKADAADSVFNREDFPAVPTQLRPIYIDGLFIKSGEELQDPKGETALMKAAAAGDAESVKLLSGAGRPRGYEDLKALQICDQQDEEGRTAFMHAILSGKTELIAQACHTESEFPKAGTNQLPSFCHTSVLALRDKEGKSALDLASSDRKTWQTIQDGLYEVLAWANGKLAGGVYLTNLQIPLRQRADAYWALGIEELALADYEFKAQLDQLDNPTLAGRIFALFEAAEQGKAMLVKKQLAEKVDPNSRNPAGETPLMKAAESGDLQTVVVLIFRGADERAQDKLGRTPLMHAAASGQAEVVKLLLEMEQLHTDADLQFRLTRLDSELPLNTDFTKMRFRPDNGLKDNLGRTAIFHAVQAENVESTLPLIRSTTSQARDEAKFTPLMYAVQAKNFDFLKQVAEQDSWSVYKGSFLQPSSFFYWNGVTGEPYVGDDTLIQYLEKHGATEAAKILRSKIDSIIEKCSTTIEKPEEESDTLEALDMRARCYRELGMAEEAVADAKAAEELRNESADK